MNRLTCLAGLLGLAAAAGAFAADRAITVPTKVALSYGFMTNSTKVQPSRHLGVGFWQRGSGAKPGVGDDFVSVVEYQLPEAAPARVRSATLQFSGKASQCVGAEPVVIEVFAFAGDGRGDVSDARLGTRVARMQADCNDRNAFSQPIDVTQIVRQTSMAAGIRHVGFNMRKANNRQGPGLFNLTAPRLTVVLADHEIDKRTMGRAGMPPPAPMAKPVAGVPGTAGVRPVASRRELGS